MSKCFLCIITVRKSFNLHMKICINLKQNLRGIKKQEPASYQDRTCAKTHRQCNVIHMLSQRDTENPRCEEYSGSNINRWEYPLPEILCWAFYRVEQLSLIGNEFSIVWLPALRMKQYPRYLLHWITGTLILQSFLKT